MSLRRAACGQVRAKLRLFYLRYSWANVGRHRKQHSPVFGQSWPIQGPCLVKLAGAQAEVGRIWPGTGLSLSKPGLTEVGPNLTEVGPSLVDSGPVLADVKPRLADSVPILVEVGRLRFGRNRAKLGRRGQSCNELGRAWSKSAQARPNRPQFGDVGRICRRVAHVWPDFDRIRLAWVPGTP